MSSMRNARVDNVTGVVLTGGQSSRFGTDKSAFVIGKNSMADRAVAAVSSVVNDVIVSGTRLAPDSANLTYVPDLVENGGPLAGISAAFGATGAEWLFVLACDMPNVSGTAIENVLGFRTRDTLAVVPRERSGRLHPLFACYHRATYPLCERLLASGALSMKRYVKSITENGLVLYPTVDETTLLNINRVSDLAGLSPTLRAWDSPLT